MSDYHTSQKQTVSQRKSCCGVNAKPRSTQERRKVLLSNILRDAREGKPYHSILESASFVTSSLGRPTNNIHPAVEKWFNAMDTKNEGKITSRELQQAFDVFQGRHFSDATCKFVVRLFDLDKNGGLDVKEFESLYYYIKQWLNAFNSYDRDKSGYLDETELGFALKHLDINFSPDFIKFLVTRTNPKAKKISLDQYLITCIQIQRFTDEFKNRDVDYSGTISITYEDFLEMILRCL
ncbi:peflin-like [Cylas formicarius]|uniref:peflin-like n=1 Tax=Cylas formicarius TaxID=197179 RepID=UPI002958C8F7|nr:peflin-like [Cylas formicarius]